MEIRKLTRTEIGLLEQLDRAETIERIYYQRQGQLSLEAEHWEVPDWSPESKQSRIQALQAVFDRGASFFGAFDGDALIGMSVLDHNPVQSGDRRLNLEGLWVSQAYRGQGIGKALFQSTQQEAIQRGARWMYVSATPSENTVRFYTRLGCQPANPVDEILFAKEPEDIHLELLLDA
jgi:GNAT superfamily N-acetyltransferase